MVFSTKPKDIKNTTYLFCVKCLNYSCVKVLRELYRGSEGCCLFIECNKESCGHKKLA